MGNFSGKDIFKNSGPLHLTSVDWENPDHQRIVVASLVNGVYVLERDRQKNRKDDEAEAPPWWKFFHFIQIGLLKDDKDHTIFGAVYEYSSYASNNNVPKYVIAFRGTLTKLDSMARDIKMDFDCWKFRLHKHSRFDLASQAVENVVKNARGANVWLAGHSLGAAIALLVGKNMAKEGKLVKTFLFNPPFVSFPIEWIKKQKLKLGIRVVSSVGKAAIAIVMKNDLYSFDALSEWVPQLYVNPADPICHGYIGYFQHRKQMEEIGVSAIERLAARLSGRCLIAGLLHWKHLEAWHLLPSANLNINFCQFPNIIKAHGIHQWWDSNFYGQDEQYKL